MTDETGRKTQPVVSPAEDRPLLISGIIYILLHRYLWMINVGKHFASISVTSILWILFLKKLTFGKNSVKQ
jgi:hypothetical protein